ncbi:MAG: hypothetical protein M1823_000418 [Watsoniomyces obsoletus]|nr:MAG: hypothetical protein M1823_000418 [Watsoniomyces obsoletus]
MGAPSQTPSRPASQRDPGYTRVYRRSSDLSASFMTDVEMAQDEVFAGPVSESVPTSIAAFSHRRSRAGSNASFAYFQESEQHTDWVDEEAIMDGADDEGSPVPSEIEVSFEELTPAGRRCSSVLSRGSVQDPLLNGEPLIRIDSTGPAEGGRKSQKIYILTEDLTIVIAGFSTHPIRALIYYALCIVTLGAAYLLCHWLPRWRVALLGRPTALRDCSWVVIENQWGEASIHQVQSHSYGQNLSTVFGDQPEKSTGEFEDDDDPVLGHLRFLEYRYIRFWFHPVRDRFMLGNGWKDPNWIDVRSLRDGLDGDEKANRLVVFGKNSIEIEQKPIPQLLVDEAIHPFYIFQVASLILWSFDNYYYYATCIFIISVFSIATTIWETKTTMARLHEMSRFECDVRVLRSGFWIYVSSMELVPGDVYEITDPALSQFPADSLLLSGDCIVNESMLTGESVPVSKLPASDQSLKLLNLTASSVPAGVARSFLFCGTKIIRARRPQDDPDDEAAALAMVLRTGFNTTKGSLVRSMLFPKPSGFTFYRDSFRYITVMAGIAMLGFAATLVNFIRLKVSWHIIVVRALDLITIVVPPALPATLSIGITFALSRLKDKQIFCISPQRVNVGGKIDIVCFDKTGTLTEDGLDILGLRVVEAPSQRFSDVLTDTRALLPSIAYERDPTLDYKANKAALYTMATCHSLRVVDDKLIGDPLDVKMFQFTGWSFTEGQRQTDATEDGEQGRLTPSVARPPAGAEFNIEEDGIQMKASAIELGVIRSFEFMPQLRRASVVVRQLGAADGDVYVKGAPEGIKTICTAESLPPDYEDLLAFYTHRGYRVIACATKHIPKLSWLKTQKLSRTDVESELQFVGFIIFQNRLKAQTTATIDELAQAEIRQVMCTGDNILTAISVARECHMIGQSAHCFVPHFSQGDAETPKSQLGWESVDNPLFQLDPDTLKPLPPPAESDASLPYDIANLKDYSIALTGDVFRWIVDYAPAEILQRALVRGQVFARMSPDEKHELVEKLQSIDYCCGFCGDGANDCSALKAADVGISLSEAEASVAAPFTSRVFDISCVPEVIREGRAALVTSFSCFKYMSLYSAIQFTTVSFLYASASNLGDFQYLYIDLLLILPIAIFMSWTGAYPVLGRKRPNTELVSRWVLIPLLGQIALCAIMQVIAFQAVRRQSWFIPPKIRRNKSNIRNSENTTLFLVSCFQYIFSSVVLSIGPPFRRTMLDNVPYVVTLVVALLVSLYLLLDPAAWVQRLMQLTYLSPEFKIFLLLLALGGFACSWLAEKYLLPILAKLIGRAKDRSRPPPPKLYKQLQLEMRI